MATIWKHGMKLLSVSSFLSLCIKIGRILNGMHAKINLPPGDILIVAGDILPWGNNCRRAQLVAEWLHQRHFRYKLVIAATMANLLKKKTAWQGQRLQVQRRKQYTCRTAPSPSMPWYFISGELKEAATLLPVNAQYESAPDHHSKKT